MHPADYQPFLQIPPFPGSNPPPFSRPGHGSAEPLTDERIDEALAETKRLRIGGSYWAAQPKLPAYTYTLLRVRSDAERSDVLAGLGTQRTVVWLPSDGARDPWHLLQGASRVIVDADDELALLAAIAEIPLQCVGNGAFAALPAGGLEALRSAFRRVAVGGPAYVDPFTDERLGLLDAIRLCGFWRDLIDSNRSFAAAFGFAFWKRPTVAPLLWNGSTSVPFKSRPVRGETNGPIAVWKTRTDPATLRQLEHSEAQLVEVEDGFIRSAGLGADCVPPLSIVVDWTGIYFDPRRPSRLETILSEGTFAPPLIERARRLRAVIVERGIGKYGATAARFERCCANRRHILVPGQVEDDRSVQCGGGTVSTNLDLLQRVRATAQDAFILYKPHPDVEAGHRKGAISEENCLQFADEIVTDAISSIIDAVDEVHVNTSLAGFEALLREKPVTTYGVPFYSGWGLTTDLGPVPERRCKRRTLDELVAAALMIYPRYLDPVTGLPCPPEIVIRRLAEGVAGDKNGPIVLLRRLQGRLRRFVAGFWKP